MRRPPSPIARRPARGVSLVIVLMILVVVSVLGIGSSQVAMLGERTARHDRDTQIAFEAAEAALVDAQYDIRGPNTSANSRVATFSGLNKKDFVDGCGDQTTNRGLCVPSTTDKPVWAQVDFTTTGSSARTAAYGEYTGRAMDTGTTGIRPAQAPRYVIEVLEDRSSGANATIGQSEKTFLYRVTAMGFGPRTETQVVLQMEFRKE